MGTPGSSAASSVVARDEAVSLVCFTVLDRGFALALSHVRELVRMVAIIPLSDAPPSVVGVINLRGRVIPVLSLRAHLGLPASESPLTDRIIVVQVGPQVAGLLVDSVEKVVTTEPVEMQRVGVDATGGHAVVVARLRDRSIPVLDPAMLYAPLRFRAVPGPEIIRAP